MRYVVNAQLCKELREKNGFETQIKLARHLGIQKRFISNAESEKPIGELMIRRIAEAFKLGVKWRTLIAEQKK